MERRPAIENPASKAPKRWPAAEAAQLVERFGRDSKTERKGVSARARDIEEVVVGGSSAMVLVSSF